MNKQDFHDAVDALTRSHIAEHGVSITGVFGDGDAAPFCYTTGLTEVDHPELVMLGRINPRIVHHLLNTIVARIRAGQPLQTPTVLHQVAYGFPLLAIEAQVLDEDHLLHNAVSLYGRERVRAIQILWPDKDGLFPTQDGYGYPASAQPLLGPLGDVQALLEAHPAPEEQAQEERG